MKSIICKIIYKARSCGPCHTFGYIILWFCLSVFNPAFALNLSHFHAPVYNSGKLIPWHIDGAGPFDYIIRIEANWWQNSPLVNGWPAYITSSELMRNYEQANGATIGTTNALGIIAYLRYYAYTGDTSYLHMCRRMGDFIVKQDLTPETYLAYPRFPWPVGSNGSITPDGSGHPACNAGEVMPDKGAMLGVALLRLYEATLDTAYLNEAVQIANVLANQAVIGTSNASPWPFRCKASDGSIVNGVLCGNQSFALRLFDELLRLGIAGNGKYFTTRENVWNFLKNIVIADTSGNKWQDFFEDHSGDEDNPTQFSALETARYLLEKRELLDSQWSAMVSSIIFTIKRHWVVHSGSYTAIGEQFQDMTPYNSHTARYASILAMYYEFGGPSDYKMKLTAHLHILHTVLIMMVLLIPISMTIFPGRQILMVIGCSILWMVLRQYPIGHLITLIICCVLHLLFRP